MPVRRLKQVTDALRYRIERGLSMRALRGGDRLPSTRDLSVEMKANPRVILAAYRLLANEGLVEIRRRSGNFVAQRNLISDIGPPPPTALMVDVLAEAVQRGYTTREFSGYLADAAFGRRLRAAVISSTVDQTEGIARELSNDFSLSSYIIPPESLRRRNEIAALFRRADFIVTTEAFGDVVARAAEKVSKPFIVITVRSNIITDEWRALMQRGVNVIACDRKFLALLRNYLGSSANSKSVQMFVAGIDSLSGIEPGNATYVTAAARKKLGATRIPGNLISPPRFLSDACVRAILNVIVALRFDREPPLSQ